MNLSGRLSRGIFPVLLVLPVFAASCEYREAVEFPLRSGTGDSLLYGLSREASRGSWTLGGNKKMAFLFDKPLGLPENCSLELEYLFPHDDAGPACQVILELGDASWVLPEDASSLIPGEKGPLRYAVPVPPGTLGGFNLLAVEPEGPGGQKGRPPGKGGGTFELRALALVSRCYGLVRTAPAGGSPLLSPFVYREGAPGEGLVIDPPQPYRIKGRVDLAVAPASPGALTIHAGERRFEGLPLPSPEGLYLSAGILPEEPYPLILRGGGDPGAFILAPAADRPFPLESLPADPGIILAYPREQWREDRYELFRWDRFPEILIFDTADYALQDRFFKRLAFFVEKAGFRGRLAEDREIAALHGWNAHDYRAEDLAAFFEAARKSNFPLLPEERELEDILVRGGILRPRENGEIAAGRGAVLSISRESPEYLRSQFMTHEGFHGLYFIDREFRDWSRRRWENLEGGAKRFILSYFDYQDYDVGDQDLVVNEFMAYCLQQPVSQAPRYFGETLAGRIAGHPWRYTVLPPGEGGRWPGIARVFEAEAAAFSAYVGERWGLAAGRVRRIIPR